MFISYRIIGKNIVDFFIFLGYDEGKKRSDFYEA